MSKTAKFVRSRDAAKAVINTKNFFDTVINAQCASAAPPLGPLLGTFGLNINNFCKTFNEKTKNYKPGIPLPVTVRIKPDRSYNINLQTPSLEFYLLQAAGITQAKMEGETKSGEITLKHIYEIAKIKNTDPFSLYQVKELDEIVQEAVNLATEMGIELVKNIDPETYREFLEKRCEYLENLAKELEEKEKLKYQRG